MSRIPYTNKVGETLSAIADPAAAYSLRALGGGDPTVARVRRSSDDAEKDFTASDMDSGSVADWVNGKQDTTLPCDVASAAAAYSLRSVNSNYTGSIVRVRRSSDNTEKDFLGNEVDKVADWVNENTLSTARNFTSHNYETFTGASSTGFTASNPFGLAYAGWDINSGTTGDIVKVSFDLNIVSGSPKIALYSSYDVTSRVSIEIEYYTSGSYTAELTATNSFSFLAFTEADIPSEFTVSNLKIYNDGHVTTWYDQSGNGNNATQSTASSQPKIVDAGVLVSNGIDFDGVDDFFESSFNSSLTDYTFIGVYTLKAIQDNAGFLGKGIGNDREFFVRMKSDGRIEHRVYSTGSASPFYTLTSPSSSVSVNTPTLIAGAFNGNTNAIRLDINDTILTATSSVGLHAGASSLTIPSVLNSEANAVVSELIFYNSDQSANRFKIDSNINNHYGLYTNANDGFVTSWYDQSGNSNDATQSVASSQPKIVDAGALVTNSSGNASIAMYRSAVEGNRVLAMSVGIVPEGSISFATVEYRRPFAHHLTGITQGGSTRIGNYDGFRIQKGGTTANELAPKALTLNEQHLITTLFAESGGTSKGRIDGNERISINLPDALSTGSLLKFLFRGDADNPEPMLYSELVLYNSDQSANQAAIETNINNYYDIY